MDHDASAARPDSIRHRNVDSVNGRFPDHPESSGTLMAQDRLRSTTQHSCHPPSMLGKSRPPNGIDAAVDQVKAASSELVLD
jgi:hypothetical protein